MRRRRAAPSGRRRLDTVAAPRFMAKPATTWLLGYRDCWEESVERLDALLAPLTTDGQGVQPPAATQKGRVQ